MYGWFRKLLGYSWSDSLDFLHIKSFRCRYTRAFLRAAATMFPSAPRRFLSDLCLIDRFLWQEVPPFSPWAISSAPGLHAQGTDHTEMSRWSQSLQVMADIKRKHVNIWEAVRWWMTSAVIYLINQERRKKISDIFFLYYIYIYICFSYNVKYSIDNREYSICLLIIKNSDLVLHTILADF